MFRVYINKKITKDKTGVPVGGEFSRHVDVPSRGDSELALMWYHDQQVTAGQAEGQFTDDRFLELRGIAREIVSADDAAAFVDLKDDEAYGDIVGINADLMANQEALYSDVGV